MSDNDEPLDDLRAVAMTAGAAAARVVETVIREQQNRRAQDQRDAERGQSAAAGGISPYQPVAQNNFTDGKDGGFEVAEDRRAAERADLQQAEQWATPERRQAYEHEVRGSDHVDDTQRAQDRLVGEWQTATGQVEDRPVGERAAADQLLADIGGATPSDYDAQRPERDRAMHAAGVPTEARQARTTADLLNGTDPAAAAASGTKTSARLSPTPKVPARERVR